MHRLADRSWRAVPKQADCGVLVEPRTAQRAKLACRGVVRLVRAVGIGAAALQLADWAHQLRRGPRSTAPSTEVFGVVEVFAHSELELLRAVEFDCDVDVPLELGGVAWAEERGGECGGRHRLGRIGCLCSPSESTNGLGC